MNHQIPFSRFGGRPDGPKIARQVLVIFSVWAVAKIWIRTQRGGNGQPPGLGNKYSKPLLLAH